MPLSFSDLETPMTHLVLNLGPDDLDRVGWLHLERAGLAGEGLDKDLHIGSVGDVAGIWLVTGGCHRPEVALDENCPCPAAP